MSLTLAVVVPSYRRPAELARCLRALAAQTRPAEQVIVVLRRDDDASRAAVTHAAPATTEMLEVTAPGQVAALNAACARLRTDVVAFTDDDCVPHPDWLARIAARFASDARIGAVGGRDIVHHGPRAHVERGTATEVGRVRRSTRLIGNHHLCAPLQDVDFLKGACMAVRAVCLSPFDARLRGTGAQVHNDMLSTLAIRRAGWRVVYDPTVRVDHFPAERFDDDGRERRSVRAIRDEHHNEVLGLLTLLPAHRRPLVLGYRLLVGTRAAPGVALLAARALDPARRAGTLRVARAANEGRLAGLAAFLRADAGERPPPPPQLEHAPPRSPAGVAR